MKFPYHLTVGLGLITTIILLNGCGSQGPMGPETGSGDNSWNAGRTLPSDEGAWQTVDLIWCGDGGDESQETPTGQLRYHVSRDLIFEGDVRARGLLPDYEYLLAIVGQPDLPAESEAYFRAGVIYYDDDAPYPYTGLPTLPGGSRGQQEYCDFALVITDQHGNLHRDFSKTLPAGCYQVTFTVKDAHLWSHFAQTGDFDTEVLRHDDVSFQITTQYIPTEQ